MSKIVQAVNAMISNPDNITKVLKGDNEYFFSYRDKYSWSMAKHEDEHFLYFYPSIRHIEEIANNDRHDWDTINMVVYRDSEIGTKEAKASFAELLNLLKEQVFGINKVLEDIISDTMPF